MTELKGASFEKFPFSDLFKVGDLVNYHGPLLSLFSNEKGELYLYGWSDSDDKYNRWLVFRITLNQLLQYLNKNLSHYQLMTTYYTDCIYSIDIDDDLNYHNVKSLNVAEIPKAYLPDKDVLHDEGESPHLEKIRSYISQLESQANEVRKKQWQHKFNIPQSSYDQIMLGSRKIVNREQLLTI